MTRRRSSPRREQQREAMRARILAAAAELVRQHGIKGLGMRALAGEVGLTAPTLYGYFASKDAVLDALFLQATEMLFTAMERAHDAGDLSAVPRFGVDALAFRTFAHEHPDLYQLLFGRVDSAYKPSEAAREAVNSMMRALSERIIPEIVAAGVAEDLAEECVQALVVTAQGYISVELNECLCNQETLEPRPGTEQEYLFLLEMMLGGFVNASEQGQNRPHLSRLGIAAAAG
jgi:AcrR family transcriptional regulator